MKLGFDINRSNKKSRKISYLFVLFLLLVSFVFGAPGVVQGDKKAGSEQGYRIDQPGTITFTVGIKISGKVEKPQVMIFLPKEKTLYREEVLRRSFIDELLEPLPFTPITE